MDSRLLATLDSLHLYTYSLSLSALVIAVVQILALGAFVWASGRPAAPAAPAASAPSKQKAAPRRVNQRRNVKEYDRALHLLEVEQGEWYVNFIIERELSHLFRHYTKHQPVAEIDEDEDEYEDESDDVEDEEEDGEDDEDEEGEDDDGDEDGDDDGDGDDGESVGSAESAARARRLRRGRRGTRGRRPAHPARHGLNLPEKSWFKAASLPAVPVATRDEAARAVRPDTAPDVKNDVPASDHS